MTKIHLNRLSRHAVVVFAIALLAAAINVASGHAEPAGSANEPDGARSLALSSVQPAGAVPAGFANWTEVFAVQDRLNAAAEKIVATGGDGYAGIVAAPETRELRVYWNGTVSPSLRQLAAGLGVPVRFLPATFTERDMLAEAKRLAADPEVLSVGPQVDGSGLSIQVTGAGREAIQSGTGIVGTARMPLDLQSGPAPQALNRQNDFAPYWGGARYATPVGGCSTGFAIFWAGLDHMLSAGHCGDNGQLAIDGGGNPAVDTMGDIFNDVPARDTLMINTPSQGFIYVGAWNNNVGVDVVGATADFVGNLVCTGGARTGEHCGIPVTGVNQFDAGFFPLTRAEFSAATCAAARGDSGGPVYHYATGNTVIGRGTISTGRPGTASCPNAPIADSSRIVFYAPLLRPAGDPQVGALQFYGASIL